MRIFALVVTIFTICGTTALINGCDEGMEIAVPIVLNDPNVPADEPGISEAPEPQTEEQTEVNLGITPPRVPETPQSVIVPDNIFTPPANTVLSQNEKDLADFFALTGRDPTQPNPQGANKPVDQISLLPLKDREEVYDALIAAVNLPFFTEAAEKMKSKNIKFASLFMEAVRTENWEKFNGFLENIDKEIGISSRTDEITLIQIYFEENPEDKPRSKECSCYWMLLEYYRLQLQNPHLNTSVAEDKKQILRLYRQSAQMGNILGLANPWN